MMRPRYWLRLPAGRALPVVVLCAVLASPACSSAVFGREADEPPVGKWLLKQLAGSAPQRFLQATAQDADTVTREREDQYLGPPRFTWNGCLCMQSWRLRGHEDVNIEDYCGNPDGDLGGDWCFVVDNECEAGSNWGQCAPPPRCVEGQQVLAPGRDGGLTPALLVSFHGQQVLIQWPDGTSSVCYLQQVATPSGQGCVHTGVEPVTLAHTVASAGAGGASSMHDVFHPDRFFPPFSLRLLRDLSVVLRNRSDFEESICATVAEALEIRPSAIEVLDLMASTVGSSVVIFGVKPDTCLEGFESVACARAVFALQGKWINAVKLAAPLEALNPRDMSFPAFLNQAECVRYALHCPWPLPATSRMEDLDRQGRADPFAVEEEWWSLSVIAFAGATPTCLCLGLLILKSFFHFRQVMRRRHHFNEVREEASSLRRLEVRVEDLNVGDDWICSICLGDEAKGKDLLLLQCKHVFHYSCMLEWIQQRLSCPMCRTSFRLRGCALYNTPPDTDQPETPSSTTATASPAVTSAPAEEDAQTEGNNAVVSSFRPSPRESSNDASDSRSQSNNSLVCEDVARELPHMTSPRACRWFALATSPQALAPHPNMVEDNEEPWWSSLPSTLANRVSPMLTDM